MIQFVDERIMVYAYLLHIDAVTCTRKDQTRFHGFGESFGLQTDFLLLFAREVDEMVVFGADEERDGGLVEASALSVPFFDAVECGFACEIEHEEDGDGVVAHEWQHVDEFSLASQIPDGEGDFCVSDCDGLFHEVDACRLSDNALFTYTVSNIPSVWM